MGQTGVVSHQLEFIGLRMKISLIVFMLTLSLMSSNGRTLTENIINGIKYKAAKTVQLLDVTKDTAEDIIEIKKNSLMDILAPINQILSIKTSAFSNILGRASTALSSIVNIKRDIIKHKVEEISDLLEAAVGTQCRTVEVEVMFFECTEGSVF